MKPWAYVVVFLACALAAAMSYHNWTLRIKQVTRPEPDLKPVPGYRFTPFYEHHSEKAAVCEQSALMIVALRMKLDTQEFRKEMCRRYQTGKNPCILTTINLEDEIGRIKLECLYIEEANYEQRN